MLISFSARTKQIIFLVIKLEPRLLSWFQPRKNNCVPTELDVSISAMDCGKWLNVFFNILKFWSRNSLEELDWLTAQDVYYILYTVDFKGGFKSEGRGGFSKLPKMSAEKTILEFKKWNSDFFCIYRFNWLTMLLDPICRTLK